MASIIENLNEVIGTKNEIKGILRDNGIDPGDVFSDYPNMLRSIVGGGSMSGDTVNSYISAYLDSYNFIDQDELSANSYITSTDLPVIDENIIPKESGTYTLGDNSTFYAATYTNNWNLPNNGGFIKINNVNRVLITGTAMRPSSNNYYTLGGSNNKWANTYTVNLYADTAYLQDTSYSSSIVPKETATYTLGDSTYFYTATYTSDVWLGADTRLSFRTANQVNLYMNGNWRYVFHTNNFSPVLNTVNLGSSTTKWYNTYTSNLWADNTYISSATYLPVNTYWYDGTTYHWLGSLFN